MQREIAYSLQGLIGITAFVIFFWCGVDKEWNLFTGKLYINRTRVMVGLLSISYSMWMLYVAAQELTR